MLCFLAALHLREGQTMSHTCGPPEALLAHACSCSCGPSGM